MLARIFDATTQVIRAGILVSIVAFCWIGLTSPMPEPGASATSEDTSNLSDHSQCLDLNTASVNDLKGLPGIGPVLAERILEQRERHGPFHKATDIIAIKGIDEHRFDQLEDLI